MKDPVFLLTNDDGCEATGLKRLRSELSQLARVVVVAPNEEQSGVGHGLTIRKPLRVFERGKDHYAVTGTPVDCVTFALRRLLPQPPVLVVSGINHGANLGDDTHYSGTVAAAREAAFYGVPAIAASLAGHEKKLEFDWAARLIRELIGELKLQLIPRGTYLNINVPTGKPKHYRFTRQGTRLVTTTVDETQEGGERVLWIDRDEKEWVIEADTDYQAIREGAVSVTPMHRDQTNFQALRDYAEWMATP